MLTARDRRDLAELSATRQSRHLTHAEQRRYFLLLRLSDWQDEQDEPRHLVASHASGAEG